MSSKNKSDKQIILVMCIAIAFFVVILACHVSVIQQTNPRMAYINLVMAGLSHMSDSFFNIEMTSYTMKNCGIFLLVAGFAGLIIKVELDKNHRDAIGKEKGDAKWNTNLDEYNKVYTDPPKSKLNNGPKNMILSQDVFLSMDGRQTLRNNNIMVVGGSGSGKSRFMIKPNILQTNCSFVVTDPAGDLLESEGKMLQEKGYKIKVFNLIEMQHSCCYNPFEYIRDDLGVVILINCLIKNTTPKGASRGDNFWEKCESALFQSLMFYLLHHRSKQDRNFSTIMKLLQLAEVDENNPGAKSKLDKLIDRVRAEDPTSLCVTQYDIFKAGAGKTLKSILISCQSRIQHFTFPNIKKLTDIDTLQLQELGNEKQALFVIIPTADDSYNYLASMMYTQLFETLYYEAENRYPYRKIAYNGDKYIRSFESEDEANKYIEQIKTARTEKKGETYSIISKSDEVLKEDIYSKDLAQEWIVNFDKVDIKSGGKRLPCPVRFLLDEFANIGEIPDFDKKLATMRKHEISCTIILQSLAQLKEMYDKKWEGIIGNCDSFLFLGGQEYSTLEDLSKKLGEATIVVRNNSRSRGGKSSNSLSYNRDARALLKPDELMRLPTDECVLIIRGLRPFKGKKYDLLKHPNYSLSGDASDENKFRLKDSFDNTVSYESFEDLKAQTDAKESLKKRSILSKTDKPLATDPKEVDGEELKKAGINTEKDVEKIKPSFTVDVEEEKEEREIPSLTFDDFEDIDSFEFTATK